MIIKDTAGGIDYSNPFLGGEQALTRINMRVDVSTLTTDCVDQYGFIKPGVPLTRSGALVGSVATAGTAVSAAAAGNTGNGVFGAVTVGAGAKAGVYRVLFIEPAANLGTFAVEDPSGILVGRGVVGTAFTGGGLTFTIADGATDFVSGDLFTVTVTLTAGADALVCWGVTFEAVPIRHDSLGNANLSTDTSDPLIAVGTFGHLSRSLIQDNLGRNLSATEVAAIEAGGFKLSP